MRQKLLFFISILMLNCLFALAEESKLPELPPLPVTSEKEIVDTSGRSKSFFEKIKSFFGFGNDENDDTITSESNVEEQTTDSTDTHLDQSSEEALEEVPEIPTISPPLGSTDEGPMSIMVPTLPDDDVLEDLQLPAGFDDDIKDASGDEAIPQVSKTESGLEVASVSVPTPDDDENKLELPPGFETEPEDEIVETKDAVEKNSDNDQDMPAIPENTTEASDVSDSDKVENQDVIAIELPTAVNNDTTDSTTAAKSSKLPVPTYVAEAEVSKTPETSISKYQKELQSRQGTPAVEAIAPEELVANTNSIEKFTAVTAAGLDNTQLEFVNNEAQVLILPNDEVVLGEVTQEAKLNFMDFRSYVKIFWQKYERIKREPKRMEIEQFIENYDENFNEEDYLYYEDEVSLGLSQAFKAVDKGNIYLLISLLNSYPILQLTGQDENNLLHEASYAGNYSAARLLVLKGIDIFAKNSDQQTALTIAEKFNNKHIVFLLKSAGLK